MTENHSTSGYRKKGIIRGKKISVKISHVQLNFNFINRELPQKLATPIQFFKTKERGDHKIHRFFKKWKYIRNCSIFLLYYFKNFVGVSSERRTNEIKRLNKSYLEVVATWKGLKESLDHMVETESYRWICRATYSLCPEPIRPNRTQEMDSDTNCVQDSVIFIGINI